MADLPFGLLAALVGLIGGLALGLAARLGQFCTLGAIETAVYGDDQRRLCAVLQRKRQFRPAEITEHVG